MALLKQLLQLDDAGVDARPHVGKLCRELAAKDPSGKPEKTQYDEPCDQEVSPHRQWRPTLQRLGCDVKKDSDKDRAVAQKQDEAELPEQNGNQGDAHGERGECYKAPVAEFLRRFHSTAMAVSTRQRRWDSLSGSRPMWAQLAAKTPIPVPR